MYPWGCCRICLVAQSLSPIFSIPEQNEKYSNIIFTVTGLKVQMNDSLPQEMCSACINFINESIKFRRKCEQTHKHLIDRLNNKQFYNVKIEMPHLFKTDTEFPASIDITETVDDNFNEDDNITLEELRYTSNYEIQPKTDEFVENNEVSEVEFETQVQDIVEKPIEIIFNSKKRYKKSDTSKLRSKKRVNKVESNKEEKRRDRKSEKEKAERVREEIECEYCHKVLTSKLSLRNHYKIHTGFDVVCEHCGKKFITRRLLLMHCRAKHGYEKTDKCSYCDYRASNAEQVKIHERLHTGEKPYVCKECNAGFHRKSSYLQHVAIHLPEKTVQCDQCPARFKSVTLMRIHKSRHRPPQYSYRCVACGNSFARRRNVARHLQRIHGLPPEQQHIDRLKIG